MMTEKTRETNIVITNVYEAMELVQVNPDAFRVLSIMDPGSYVRFLDAKEALYLEFHDITPEDVQYTHTCSTKLHLSTKEHCQQALDFLGKGGRCLVHCAAGKRRSTAMALGYLVSTLPNYQEAVDKLYEMRPIADPNLHVLRLMCKIIGKENDYLGVLASVAFRRLNQ